MLKNYFKVAVRILWKNRVISSINIIGLSISVALCLLLFFYIRYERSFDGFHTKKDRLFRLEATQRYEIKEEEGTKRGWLKKLTGGEETNNSVVFPFVIAEELQAAFPEVKSITRMAGMSLNDEAWKTVVEANDKVFKETDILDVDANFFENFSFPLLKGNPATVLEDINSMVLSGSVALKYFGSRDPIGQRVVLDNDTTQQFIVTGIAADAPANSGIRYSMVYNIRSRPDYTDRISSRLNTWSHQYIIELATGVDAARFQHKLNSWMRQKYGQELRFDKPERVREYQWLLRPLQQCHYSSKGWGHYTNSRVLYLLTCLSLLILVLASVNYILLTIAGAIGRIKEVGMRKLMGAGRKRVVFQLWMETLLVVLLCMVSGLFFARLGLPLFNRLLDVQISFSMITFKEILIAGVSLAVLLSLLAGCYPAAAISATKAVTVVKSGHTYKINPRFSNPLIVFQFFICFVLVIAIIVISTQMRYISRRDLGFNKEQVLLIKNEAMGKDLSSIRNRLFNYARTQPQVVAMSGIGGDLKGSYNYNRFKLNGAQQWYSQIRVDYDYFKLLNIPLTMGRVFSADRISDTVKKARACVINESFYKLLGPGNVKLGEYNETIRATVIGVCKDYNFESLTKPIGPQQHVLTDSYENYFMFKVRGVELGKTIDGFRKEWSTLTHDYPFEFTFLDASLGEMYKTDMRWQQIISVAAFFAVSIACLGLLGFSLLSMLNRSKEIGIRKVLGATIKDISVLLTRKIVLLIFIGLIIAGPFSWLVMNEWLREFAYRVQISWWMYLFAGALVIVLALLTVSVQTLKTAVTNPVKSLRNE
ncbi:ABC transporter permease [Niabella aurantiaca]|uniref:ABC transporter permease n=1 Tax=Niabella aurantiaca TaxID=379900 RepID=UPI00036B84C0|nr:ABC transporter permease [Niabella aurantiaca]